MVIPIGDAFTGPLALKGKQFRYLLGESCLEDKTSQPCFTRDRGTRARLTAELPKPSFDIRDHIDYIARLQLPSSNPEYPNQKVRIDEYYISLRKIHDEKRALALLKQEIISEMDRLYREEGISTPFRKRDLSNEILLHLALQLETLTAPNRTRAPIYDEPTRDLIDEIRGYHQIPASRGEKPKASPSKRSPARLKLATDAVFELKPVQGVPRRISYNIDDLASITLLRGITEELKPIIEQARSRETSAIQTNTKLSLEQRKCQLYKQLYDILVVYLDGLKPSFLRALVNETKLINNGTKQRIKDTPFLIGRKRIHALAKSSNYQNNLIKKAQQSFNDHLPHIKNADELAPFVSNFCSRIRIKVLTRIVQLFNTQPTPYFKQLLKNNNPNFKAIELPENLSSGIKPYEIIRMLNHDIDPILQEIDFIENAQANFKANSPKPSSTISPVKIDKAQQTILEGVKSILSRLSQKILHGIRQAMGSNDNTVELATQAPTSPNKDSLITQAASAIEELQESTGIFSRFVSYLRGTSVHKKIASILNIVNPKTNNAETQSDDSKIRLLETSLRDNLQIKPRVNTELKPPGHNDEATARQKEVDSLHQANRNSMLTGISKSLKSTKTTEAERKILRLFTNHIIRPTKIERNAHSLAAA